jgi:hypothetical protein
VKKEMNEDQKLALNKYMSFDFYPIQEKLRNGEKLSEEEAKLVNDLSGALRTLDKYKGEVSRSVHFYTEEELKEFLDLHTKGDTVIYETFTSATAGDDFYNPDAKVQLLWTSKNGRDLTAINKAEREILYDRNAMFEVTEVVQMDDNYYILMKEKKHGK